jgi:uncharacterized protein DUF669
VGEFSFKQLSQDANTVLTGDHEVVFVKTEATKSQNGKPMIKCDLKITAGPYAGRVVKHNFTISAENPQAMKFFFSDMKKLGLDEKYFDNDPSMAQIAGDLLGRTATATLENNPWNGMDREQVKTWKASGGLGGVMPTALGGITATALPVSVPAAVVTATEAPDDPF